MKFVITEEEKKQIRNLYNGLLNEQKNFVVSIEGKIPYRGNNTDWDLVHAYYGAKRLDDDLEKRVSDALANGNYVVENVVISSKLEGNVIVTRGSVYLRDAQAGENPHKYFTTRGSISSDPTDYENRHDTQTAGLQDRLKSYYKSNNVKTFGPFVVPVKGTNYGYKQSFFAVEGQSSQPTQTTKTQTKTIQGTSLSDLRNKMKSQVDLSIDPSSFKFDMSKFLVTFNTGNTNVKSLSLIYDDQGNLQSRLPEIQSKNPTMKIADQGKSGSLEWAILYFQ